GRAPAGPRAIHVVSNALLRVAEGQTMEFQLKLPASDPASISASLETWTAMAARKTGALLGACLQAGAIAAGADPSVIDGCAAYGDDLGLLFQAQDDYLDIVGDKARRSRGSDLLEGKLSFPVVW